MQIELDIGPILSPGPALQRASEKPCMSVAQLKEQFPDISLLTLVNDSQEDLTSVRVGWGNLCACFEEGQVISLKNKWKISLAPTRCHKDLE